LLSGQEGVRSSRLAFLAPAIVEQIAEGRQPPELTAQALRTGRVELPVVWAAQRQTLENSRDRRERIRSG
jgi:hypothetical protein